MATKGKSTDTNPAEEIVAQSLAGLERVNSAMADGAKHVQAMLEAGYKAWGAEAGPFFEKMSHDGAEAWRELSRCKTPMEMLAVEQAWFSKRAKAYAEAGRRFAETIQAAQPAAEKAETPPEA